MHDLAETASKTPGESSGVDILVVDDNPANLEAVAAILGDLGERVVSATSGREALRRMLEQDFALVILDVQMPTMDGFETARLIRSRERSRHVPIIFVTAYDRDEQQMLAGYDLGAVDFLFKPIVPEVLRAKVAVFVELRRRSEEIRRQADLLRQHAEREHERHLREERNRWEAETLRRQMEEQARASQELAAVNQELERADRRKDEFLAMLAHELRNPLMPITTGLALAETVEVSDPTLKKVLEIIDRQAKHLTRLVDDLLDVARITAGKIELRRSRLDLGEVLGRALEVAQPLVDEKNHTVVLSLPEQPVVLEGDPDRLAQAISNLVNNAARYTDPGGHIEVALEANAETASVRVRDDGPGMSAELIEDIFDLFVQKHPGQGLGLGLPLVKQLVEMHHGSIEATSEGEGHGSEFILRLPVSDQPLSEHPMPTREQARERQLRIVVVEDNDDVRELVRQLLESHGHKVETAGGGSRGAALIISERPDAALVDIGMPDLDGYEVARRVRAALPGPGPRLVALTGFGQEQDRQRALDAGFDAHLVKPVSSRALLGVLSNA